MKYLPLVLAVALLIVIPAAIGTWWNWNKPAGKGM